MYFKQADVFMPDLYFPQCHSASIIEMPNKSLIVSFFGGSREKAKDVGSYICKKKLKDPITKWTPPKLFIKWKNKPTGTANFFVPPNKRNEEVWVFYNLMHGKGWSTCNCIRHIYRKRNVATLENYNNCNRGIIKSGTNKNHKIEKRGWLKHDYIRRMIGWNTSGKILVADNGTYILPMHDELFGYKAYFLISKDSGKTWKKSGPIKTKKGCLEPRIIQLKDGRILCFLRTKEREIYCSWSLDRGKTWTKPYSIGLPNPDSMVDAVLSPNNRIILVYNHSKTKRNPLVLCYSEDNGKNWSKPKIIKQRKEKQGEFSYPWIIFGSDRFFHLAYTNNRKTITYAKFDEEWAIS
ncbi:MAG: exo-alpha-sialidase [Promethearchaeota archaeon]